MGTAKYAIVGFAHGCFWSKEYYWQQVLGVVHTRVGYTGGHTAEPSYQEVCTKKTGHAETVEVTYDPAIVSFEQLLFTFFQTHDATVDRRNKGGQYRSAIFPTTPEQMAIAHAYLQQLHQKGVPVTTELKPMDTFWQAEDKHQGYCQTRGREPNIKSSTPMKANYQPINCDFYDYLEIAAMRKTPVTIALDATLAGQSHYQGLIQNLVVEDGIEYMILEGEQKVRLDAIQTFNGQPLPSAC